MASRIHKYQNESGDKTFPILYESGNFCSGVKGSLRFARGLQVFWIETESIEGKITWRGTMFAFQIVYFSWTL